MKTILALLFVLSAFMCITTKADDCSTCQYVVGIIEEYIEDNATDEEIIKYLEDLCTYIPAFEAVCDQIVEYGIEEFVAYIKADEDPKTVCTQIGFCSSNKPAMKLSSVPLLKIAIDNHLKELGDTCTQCKGLVNAVESWLASSATIQEIEQLLQAACSALPALEQVCDAIVDAGVPQLIQWIQEYENGTVVCQQLGVCSGVKGLKKPLLVKPMSKDTAIKANLKKILDKISGKVEGSCGQCEMIVSLIEQWVSSSSTEQEIEQYLQDICNQLSGEIGELCNDLVQTLPQIISWIESNENATTICTQLGLCGSAAKVVKPMKIVPVDTTPKVGDSCSTCEMVVSYVEEWLSEGATQAEIEALLEAVCNALPAFQQACDAVVEAGIPQFINWIEQEENATVVCQQLGLCGSSAKKPVFMTISKPIKKVGNGNCVICQSLITLVEKWLKDNKTETVIEEDLQKFICNVIPDVKSTCDAIVKVGIPQLIDWIEQYETPQVVCQQLGLCATVKLPSMVLPGRMGIN